MNVDAFIFCYAFWCVLYIIQCYCDLVMHFHNNYLNLYSVSSFCKALSLSYLYHQLQGLPPSVL